MDEAVYAERERKVVGITVREVLKKMEGRFVNFPNDYLVLDLETTGLHPTEDLVTQIGWCLVQGREVVDRGGLVLNWTSCEQVDQDWLQKRLLSTKYHMETDKDGNPTGRTYHMNYERMRSEGVDPVAGLQGYFDLISDAVKNNLFILGHNIVFFDLPRLQHHFQKWLGQTFALDPRDVVDSGMIEKAGQAGMTPWCQESPYDFYRRISRERLKGVLWSLDGHCIPKYNLAEKHALDMSQAHGADFDCLCTHLLFAEFQQLAAS